MPALGADRQRARRGRVLKAKPVMSWLEMLHKAKAELAAQDCDPWRIPLEHVRGQIGDDGLERVTTQMLLDVLGLPQRNRRAGTYRRLSKLMAELGWMAVRVRGLTRGGYLEQVRGYCRDAGHERASPNRNAPRWGVLL